MKFAEISFVFITPLTSNATVGFSVRLIPTPVDVIVILDTSFIF